MKSKNVTIDKIKHLLKFQIYKLQKFKQLFNRTVSRMNRPGTSISKAKVTKVSTEDFQHNKVQQQKMPTLEDYVKQRDWIGAVALLQSQRNVNIQVQNSLWLAYCYFHMGQYRKAINIYDELLRKTDDDDYHIFKACCYYALCLYDDAKRQASKCKQQSPLQTRLLFHLAHKKNDEKSLMQYHQKLSESAEDQLTLAAIHYLRGHYEEATEIYKKLLLESRKYEAVNVYIALCYYKMEYHDVSLQILSGYETFDPESIFTANLKACNNYQVYSGKNAEQVLRPIQQKFKGGDLFKESDLLRHNLVVFRGGQNAMQILPPLIELFPQTRLNMVIYCLKNENTEEAFNLVKDLNPTNPREYIIKAVALLQYGQKKDSREHLKSAQQLFQIVGASATECDTIPGRQCMASCFFLLKQFDDVLVYLNSIKSYFQSDDDFHWNNALACAATGDYKEAEASFLQIRNQKYKTEECYIKWLIRTYIMNGKAKNAWDVYLSTQTSADSYNILQLIGNDCYKMGHFYYALKAFEALEKIDSENDYEDALRGSVIGVLQMVIAGKESVEHLIEAAAILKSIESSPSNQVVIKVIKKWSKENGLELDDIGL